MLLYTRYYIALNIISRAHVWQKRTRTINIIAIYSTTHWQTLVIYTLAANDNSHWFLGYFTRPLFLQYIKITLVSENAYFSEAKEAYRLQKCNCEVRRLIDRMTVPISWSYYCFFKSVLMTMFQFDICSQLPSSVDIFQPRSHPDVNVIKLFIFLIDKYFQP